MMPSGDPPAPSLDEVDRKPCVGHAYACLCLACGESGQLRVRPGELKPFPVRHQQRNFGGGNACDLRAGKLP